jgi:probable HAF family extracellular repeat protein
MHAVRWTGTTPEDLGTLGGTNSYGYGINASGQVAGWSDITGDGGDHAVVWTGTALTDLGTLGGSFSKAYGINSLGDVIGISTTAGNASTHAFLYTGGTMFDLNDLILPDSGITNLGIPNGGVNDPYGNINDFGQIAEIGTGAASHALRLDPVPEPASAVLLLGGAALLGLRRQR